MKRSIVLLLCLSIVSGGLGTFVAARQAEAFVVIPFPFFTPIAECGTVGTVPSTIPPEGECQVWFADSGGAYIVSGVENFEVGDRLFVDGLICNTCLTTCLAGAILNSTITPGCAGK